jgi:hypothetical protein
MWQQNNTFFCLLKLIDSPNFNLKVVVWLLKIMLGREPKFFTDVSDRLAPPAPKVPVGACTIEILLSRKLTVKNLND